MRATKARGLGFAVIVLSLAGQASAQPSRDTRTAAVALFDEARKLMTSGDFASACPKLEESQRMDPGIGTLFNLSDCYEHLGKTASAWIGFRDAAAEASSKNQPDREKAARARAAALEPKLVRLRIVVAPDAAAAGVEIKRDGNVVARALWGTPIPVDPGKHVIAATAPDKRPFEAVVATDRVGSVVDANIPALENAPHASASPALTPAPPPTVAPLPSASPSTAAPPADAPPPASSRAWQKPLGIVATSVGAVGLGVGTAVGLMAKSSFDASNRNGQCDTQGFCSANGKSLRDDAVNKGNIATPVFIAGAVLAAGGLVLWITAPSNSVSAQSTAFGVTPNGFVARRAW